MMRGLPNLLTLLSLLLLLAVAGLWARSRGDGDQFVFTTGGRIWWVMSGRSTIRITTVANWPGAERPRWMPRVMKNTNDHIPTVARVDTPPWSEWRRLGVHGERGLVTTWLDDGGKPARLSAYLAAPPSGGGSRSAPMRCTEVYVPYWMALALLGAPPLAHAAVALRGALRRRRLAARQCCPDCGYDLRATPGRCPECGTAGVAT